MLYASVLALVDAPVDATRARKHDASQGVLSDCVRFSCDSPLRINELNEELSCHEVNHCARKSPGLKVE